MSTQHEHQHSHHPRRQRTAVVVGATSGIGEACADRLAEEGFQVIAVGRDRPGRADAIIQRLTQISNEHSKSELQIQSESKSQASLPSALSAESSSSLPHHQFYPCDAFSLKDIRQTGERILKNHKYIDALVMTQGMATTQGFTPTAEGNDEKMTLHYYSRMAMIQTLLPGLMNAASQCESESQSQSHTATPVVVLSVLSGGVHSAYQAYRMDPMLKSHYSIKNAADAAGYYTDLTLDFMARRQYQNQSDNNSIMKKNTISFVHASPGFVNTNWGSEFHPILRSIIRLLQPLGKKPSDCAQSLLGATVLAQTQNQDGIFSKKLSKQKCSISKDNNNDNNNNDIENETNNGVYIIGEHGEPQSLTKEHTPEAREFIWKHTCEVLAKSGISMDPPSS